MKHLRLLSFLVPVGSLCWACSAAPDARSDPAGNADPAESHAGGKEDNPTDDPLLDDPPAEVVNLAPEFFEYRTAFTGTELGVGRSPAGGIFLRASDCDRVTRHVDALLSLRKRVEPAFHGGTELAPAVPLTDGWCEAKLDAVLTPYLAQTFWKRIDDTAVDINCWGHALRAVEAIPSIVAAESDLFTHVIESPQCRQLAVADDPTPGDIVAIRAATLKAGHIVFEEFHGAVWVTDQLWITKNGASRFDISPSSFVLDVYARVAGRPNCSQRTDASVSAEHVRDCGLVVQAFRCESLAAYDSAQPDGLPVYQSLLDRVRGLLDHRVVMQQEQEGQDGVVARGTAYVSRHPFGYVEQAYHENGLDIPADVQSYLAAANRDARLAYAYDLTEPSLPELPARLVAELQERLGSDWEIWQGDGFGTFCTYFGTEHDAAFARFAQAEATMSSGDRRLTIGLLLQLASSDCRSWEAARRLEPFLGAQ